MSKCKRLTVDQLAKKLAAEKGRKLTADERAGLKVLPPQFVCGSDGSDHVSTETPSTSGQISGHIGFKLDGVRRR